jgi:hypothetical protein
VTVVGSGKVVMTSAAGVGTSPAKQPVDEGKKKTSADEKNSVNLNADSSPDDLLSDFRDDFNAAEILAAYEARKSVDPKRATFQLIDSKSTAADEAEAKRIITCHACGGLFSSVTTREGKCLPVTCTCVVVESSTTGAANTTVTSAGDINL